jgi:hypothetical protein
MGELSIAGRSGGAGEDVGDDFGDDVGVTVGAGLGLAVSVGCGVGVAWGWGTYRSGSFSMTVIACRRACSEAASACSTLGWVFSGTSASKAASLSW